METCIATLVSISLFFISSSQIHTNTGALNKSFLFCAHRLWAKCDLQMRERQRERERGGGWATARSMTLTELFTWNFIVIQMFCSACFNCERNKSHEFIDFEKCISSILSNIDLKWLCEYSTFAMAFAFASNIQYNPYTMWFILYTHIETARHIVIVIWFNSISLAHTHTNSIISQNLTNPQPSIPNYTHCTYKLDVFFCSCVRGVRVLKVRI